MHAMYKTLLPLLLSISLIGNLHGQSLSNLNAESFRFDYITEADGLLHNGASTVLQDHLGFMWFGTLNGLVRYDGVDMQIYEFDASVSLADRDVRAVLEDPDGNLWVGARVGLFRFERTTGHFTYFPMNGSNERLIFSISGTIRMIPTVSRTTR
jgi:ligand-binding sensor domain-containing protein